MNLLSDLGAQIQSGGRLYSILAVVLVVVALLGSAIFVRSSILPQWQLRSDLAARLAAAEQQLLDAEQIQQQSPDRLWEQIETAQTQLEEAAGSFFTESQAAEVLDHLYQYANESGVEILDLQSQAGPEGEEKQAAYDVKTFRMEVAGSVPDLIGFTSRIKEATLESFLISDVNLTEGERLYNLMMNVTLYTSPYSSGAVEDIEPVLISTVTPVSLTELEESLATAWAEEDWDRAIHIIDQILAVNPDDDDMIERLYMAHTNYGSQLLAAGDGGQAIAQFSLALEINPGGEEALAGLQRASATPTPTPTAREQLVQSLDTAWKASDWEEVISLIGQILAIDPDDAEMTEKLYAAYVNFGYLLAAQGKREEAKQAFSDALTVKPDGQEAQAGLQQLTGETLPPTPAPETQYIIHVVQQGENLFRIALRYGTTVDAIMAANGLTSHTIYVGQELRIPVR